MATITHRVGLGRNLTAAEVDANFDSLNSSLGVTVQDEGSPLSTTGTTLNFVGSGVTVSGSGATKTVTITGGGDALTANPLSQFAPTTSAQLAGIITNETGTGSLVFASSPSLVTPNIGAATATSINKVTVTAVATGATLTLVDNTTVTGPAASGTLMTLGNAESVTGAKTFSSGKVIYAGATSGTITVNAAAVAGSNTLTLPAATDTLVGKATTDTFTNKTFDTAGGGNSFSINGVAVTANTGTGSVVRGASPTFSGTIAGTFTLPATATMASTPSQADNSTKIATTAYVDTLGATKVTTNSPVSLTGANTLTQASHFNRHLSWTGSSTAAQAISSTASTGDYVELTNDGTAVVTFTGITPLVGFKAECQPGETFQAVYSNSAWVSLTPNSQYIVPQNSKSAAYTTVMTDAGKHIYHPSADTTARTWTIDSNANVAYPIGTTITFVNDSSAGTVTISITSDTLVLAGSGSTGSRTLAANGVATAIKVTSTRWMISGTGLT